MNKLFLFCFLLIFLVGCTCSQGFITYSGEELELEDHHLRKETVEVNLELLEEDRVNIDLFGAGYVMIKEKVEYNELSDSYSWHGYLEGESDSSIILVYDEDSIVGDIWNYLPGGSDHFRIEGNENGFSISQTNPYYDFPPD